MQSDVDTTLRNLGVLAAIRQNDKLSTESDHFTVCTPTTMRALVRFCYRESREQNMTRVTNCIRNARAFVTSVLAEQQSHDLDTNVSLRMHQQLQIQLCARVMNALSAAMQGMDNLCETYHDDAAMLVKIKQLKDEVIDFLESSRSISVASITTRLEDPAPSPTSAFP